MLFLPVFVHYFQKSVVFLSYKFVIENNLPYISIHGLRHTNASIMISSGVPITTTAKRLGHSTSATTSRVYAHAIASADAMTADVIQSILPLRK